MKPRTKATKEIEDYLAGIEHNIKSLLDKDVKCWVVQVTYDVLNIVEEHYTPKQTKEKEKP